MPKREKWNERYAARELVWSAGPNARFAEEVGNLPPGTALDVACGEGRNALWLAEQGWAVTAVDFSDVAIGKARQIAAKRGLNVHWQVLDVAREPLPDTGFDLVAVLYLHTEAAERSRWLPKVIAATRPGGTFIYIGHDPTNIEHGVGGPQDPTLLPDADELTRLLADFEVLEARVVERPVTHDPGHGGTDGTALDTVVRAVRRKSR
jgi:SAM-dependent methyltransferase